MTDLIEKAREALDAVEFELKRHRRQIDDLWERNALLQEQLNAQAKSETSDK